MKLYKRIAQTLQAIENCQQTGNQVWIDKHTDTLHDLEKLLPSGSGIDAGCKIGSGSTHDKIVIEFDYHLMNENGMYERWIDFGLRITPSLCNDFDIHITGRDKDGIKEYLYDLFYDALETEVK